MGLLSPVSVIPPLRELAPQPIVSASSTTTFVPRFAKVRAALNPVYPPPMIATSTLSGMGVRACPEPVEGVRQFFEKGG